MNLFADVHCDFVSGDVVVNLCAASSLDVRWKEGNDDEKKRKKHSGMDAPFLSTETMEAMIVQYRCNMTRFTNKCE